MSPENNLVLKRRFYEFRNAPAWEQRKLGEVGVFHGNGVNKKVNKKDKPVLLLNYMDVYNRKIITAGNCHELMQVTATPKQLLENDVQRHDVFFTPTSETAEDIGRVHVICNTVPNLVYSYHLMRFRPHIGVFSPLFPLYLLETELVRKQMTVSAQGVQRFVLSKAAFEAITIITPSIEEQGKISSFLGITDNLITLHQHKLDKLKELKQSYLAEMFPAEGERTPKLRFAGFTDDWEQRELGEVGQAQSGVGFPDKEQGGKSGTPFFKVSDMNTKGNESEMTVANNYVTSEQITAHNWKPIDDLPAMFFAKVGAAVMLNRKRLCRFPFLMDNNTMAYSLEKNAWYPDFAKALFETLHLPSLVQVGALPSYNATDVEAMEILLPKFDEQKEIGAFFRTLDSLITLHQRKLEKLQNIKKAYLYEMFPRMERE